MGNDDESVEHKSKVLARSWPELIDSWFGDTARAAVDLMGGHYVQELAKMNRECVAQKLTKKLEARKIDQPKIISPRVLVPALTALSEESDDALQELWANLMANAMDPDADVDLQKILIETLRQLEPIDAVLLAQIDAHAQLDTASLTLETIASNVDFRPMALALSHERLARLGCVQVVTSRFAGKQITATDGKREYSVRGQHPTFDLTALGIELLRAVRPVGLNVNPN